MEKTLLTSTLVSLWIAGCSTPEPQKTSLEIQAIQAKNFDASKKVAFNAVMSVLQDLGFIVQSASLETGFITADSPVKKDTSGGATFLAIFGGARSEGKSAVTASVEEITDKKSRVRLNFINRSMQSSSYGQNSTQDTPVLDPAVYQKAFDKIGEAIFIRTAH
jgi:hypothetical protein